MLSFIKIEEDYLESKNYANLLDQDHVGASTTDETDPVSPGHKT